MQESLWYAYLLLSTLRHLGKISVKCLFPSYFWVKVGPTVMQRLVDRILRGAQKICYSTS